ncbi:MAG: WecB/TagA/CpsF family glycosyltransferase [Chthonomonadales bacterium]
MPDNPISHIQSVPILGLHVHKITMAQTLDVIDSFVKSGTPHHVITLDASMCVIAKNDPELFNIVSTAELITPDSIGVMWACKRSGNPLPERVSGVEIVDKICAVAPQEDYRIYFFGSAPGVAADAMEKMKQKYPGCNIVGAHDGFFTSDQETTIVQEIAASKPDILCVALGIPRQEKFIAKHRNELNASVMIGVGGTFDVHSGRVKRAPVIFQKLNLEWLYRTVSNPKKISKAMTLPKFVMHVLRNK